MGSRLEPFVIPLATLREGVNRLELTGSPEDVDIPKGEVELVGEIGFRGILIRSEARVEVQATVRARVRQLCDRCVAPVETSIEVPSRLFCDRRGSIEIESRSEGSAEEPGLMYHDGRTLDLRDQIRELVLLEVPWHPLCSPECKGLCPQCGKDRNHVDCGCSGEERDSPWDVLRTMIEAEGRPSDRSQKEE